MVTKRKEEDSTVIFGDVGEKMRKKLQVKLFLKMFPFLSSKQEIKSSMVYLNLSSSCPLP